MPDQWMRDGVRSAITRESETGGRISRAELQDELGIGASDMTLVLDELREAGLIREEVPGEYDLNPELEVNAREPEPEPEAAAAREGFAPGGSVAHGTGSVMLAGEEEMRLNAAMIEALDDEALGKVVRAGVGGGEFLLRVVP